jgi:glycosyltransferase involved in cell wall biosynthesis
MNENNVFIVIPTYNEVKAIGPIVSALDKRGFRIVVIDDGSRDKTIVEANKFGAEIIAYAKNAGKGRCIREGLEYAMKNGCEVAITMDGDGQHSLNDIDKFLDEYKRSEADLILGNRLHNPKNMPFIRRCTNSIMSFMISLLITKKVDDSQCGYRLISRKGIEKMQLTTTKYEIESEMLMEAKRRGLKMSAVNIDSI